MKSRVLLPNKETVVLCWFSTLLSTKYSNHAFKKDQLHRIWQSFLACLKKVDMASKSLEFKTDFLIDIAEHLDFNDETIRESVKLLLSLAFKEPCDETVAVALISKLVNIDESIPVISENLALLQNLSNFKPESLTDIGNVLGKLSRHIHLFDTEIFLKILKKLFFPKPEDYQVLFENLSSAELDKCTFSDSVTSFINYLSGGGDISLVISLLKRSGYPPWLACKIFCLSIHLEGYSTPMVNSQSVVFAQLKLHASPSSHKLARIIHCALPVDTAFQVNDKLTLGSVITGLLKYSLDTYGLCSDTSSALLDIYQHHPLTLEPIASSLLISYLDSSDAPSGAFDTLLGLALKLRQLPKMVSKLMLQLRSYGAGKTLLWKQQDLFKFGDAISQVYSVNVESGPCYPLTGLLFFLI